MYGGAFEPCLLLPSARGEVAPEKPPHQLSLWEKGKCSVRLQDRRHFTTSQFCFPLPPCTLCCFIYPFPLSRFYRSSGLECWDAGDLRRLLLCFEVIAGWPCGGCNVKVTRQKKIGDTGQHFLKRQDSSLLAALPYQAHTRTRSSFPISLVLMKSR